MNFPNLLYRRMAKSLLVLAILISAWAPAHAAVSTVHSCPSSGHNGNHDDIFNGFYVKNLNATNLHSVQLFYTASQSGTYNLSLTVRRNSFAGPLVGTLSKTVSLSNSSDTAVTWTFADPSIPSGSDLYFIHGGGGGSVRFNLQSNDCAGNQETVGTSSIDNGFSVAVTITQTVADTVACVANAQTLCIDDQPGDKRFQIRVTYSTVQSGGLSGDGHPIPLSTLGVSQGGLFWFFGATNPELLIKVLNACTVNSRFWVFFSAGTNVGFHVTVTDLKTGHVLNFTNPDLTPAPPFQDTSTLPCQ